MWGSNILQNILDTSIGHQTLGDFWKTIDLLVLQFRVKQLSKTSNDITASTRFRTSKSRWGYFKWKFLRIVYRETMLFGYMTILIHGLLYFDRSFFFIDEDHYKKAGVDFERYACVSLRFMFDFKFSRHQKI